MRALTAHMHHVRFDLKAFTRTLLNSRVYQLSSQTSASNHDDHQNFSRAAYRSLPASRVTSALVRSKIRWNPPG